MVKMQKVVLSTENVFCSQPRTFLLRHFFSHWSEAMHQEKAMSCPNRKAAVCKTGREPSPGPESAEALILDFWPEQLWGNNFLLYESPSLWYFVTVAWADWYHGSYCSRGGSAACGWAKPGVGIEGQDAWHRQFVGGIVGQLGQEEKCLS